LIDDAALARQQWHNGAPVHRLRTTAAGEAAMNGRRERTAGPGTGPECLVAYHVATWGRTWVTTNTTRSMR
jgi:hypothetical protein